MENNNGKTIALIALFIGVIGLSIGFAALNTNLTINGSAEVQASTWDVHFENLSSFSKTGNAAEVTAPTIKENNGVNSTLIGEYSVTLMTPGDTASYTFDIKNAGDYNARISTVTIPTPTCNGSGTDAATDAANVCDNLAYTLTYTTSGETVKVGDTLNSGQTVNVTLKLAYSTGVTADKLPKGDVTISNLQIPITYVQN